MKAPVDLQQLKKRHNQVWSSGDYAVIGTGLLLTAELLAEACDLRYDETVLDVAAGNGNASLAAARRGCVVTSTDFVGALLERGRERARAERFDISFLEADAEALPFADASFDAVLSTFGVMFTPDQPRAAAELARVCRPGGRIGLACWTPDGFVGQMFKALARHVPPPEGIRSPLQWGNRSCLDDLFAATASEVRVTPRLFNMRYRSAQHFIDTFRAWYGPLHMAFASLSANDAQRLQQDLSDLLQRMNRAGSESLIVPAEYLEVVIVRR
ncbi:methyltransferase domain-containing protein [Pseudomonas sp. 21LCFQ02]|uniref:class I SAM-dependent methyltransferase n=1 Tax=Pseudomonas sp. 21LCFQ02 TaxID=2957505 RepID=UPI00209B6E41|nr:class I SAM-dependent methyltransferase [Pseudomonas sp. 21LCFQ02]MCO8168788.1 methyltransferase domain-containing protein [Pseudomonas sp. 21LCFQ02]